MEATKPATPIAVGIDLGTTNSLVAVCDERGPRVIEDEAGRALLPSVVRYNDDGGVVVGHEAKLYAHEFPAATVSSAKRLMGRSASDARKSEAFVPFRIVAGENDTARIQVSRGDREEVHTPQEIAAVILRELRQRASKALGVEASRAVITVPAYFDDAQRQATKDAGRLAGLDVIRIVNEPTAAALAYGLGAGTSEESSGERIIAVYDLGGGTFDVSILRITPARNQGETSFFEVLATAGDTHLGGDDADHALMTFLLGGDPAGLFPADRRILKNEAESLKIRLSEHEAVNSEFAIAGRTLSRLVTREQYEKLISPLVDRTIEHCRRAIADAARTLKSESPPAIERVIMVGGMTRTPLVRRRIGEFFHLEPYIAVDPDQVVALGAAVQASILTGRTKGALLLDVIPLSLGIETVGGAVAKLIVRNSTVPAKASEFFSTSVDNQTSIRLSVFQGEREMAADCRKLGEFHVRGIPPMPAGIPQLEVRFLVDSSGVLNVSAHERRSGKRAALQVIPNHGLTREEVDRMELESYAHAREDMQRHRIVDLIANSKLDLKWIGERFERFKDILEPENRVELQRRMEALRDFVQSAEAQWDSVNADEFHRAKEALDRASMRLQEVGIAMSLKAEGRKI
ncbi:MAG: Fe-S protein assembly chaperone HscA [Phycisphaeraceae bacterium]|nr:Fe-S protein assembly chaperone HscA [Phycisphaeraceae bacterium]